MDNGHESLEWSIQILFREKDITSIFNTNTNVYLQERFATKNCY